MKALVLASGLAALLLMPARGFAEEGLVLKFQETHKITNRTPAKMQVAGKPTMMDSATTSTENSYAVTLMPNVLSIRNGDDEDLYDFLAKRYYRIQHAKKTYYAYPIEALPLYRHILKDRMTNTAYRYEAQTHTTRLVHSGDGFIEDVQGLHLDLETIYGSVSDSTTGSLIKTTAAGGATVFTSEYGPIADVTPSAVPIPGGLFTAYRRFLAYGPVLHPLVEEALAKITDFPQKLDYTTRDHLGHDVSSEWVFGGATPVSAAPALPEGFTQIFTSDADLNASITAAQGPGPTEENYAQKISGYQAQHDNMRAVLSLYEMLATVSGKESDKATPLMNSILQSANDPLILKLTATLGKAQTTEADITYAEAVLKDAKAQAPDYGYFIDVYRARNMRAELAFTTPDQSKVATAIAMDANALLVNPWLVPAYADLGDASYEGGDGTFAWTCWEQAQRLKPDRDLDHKMAQLKQKALADFPEYF